MRSGAFRGVSHALDVANVPGQGDRRIYLSGYLSSIGIPEDRLEAAIDRLIPGYGPVRHSTCGGVSSAGRSPSCGISTHADLRLGIVSNSDGHVEEELARNKICQVGPGQGVPVRTIIDSGVVGVAKPDPTIFDFALPSLDLDCSDVIYVGDSVKYDIRSAEGRGDHALAFRPIHPLRGYRSSSCCSDW